MTYKHPATEVGWALIRAENAAAARAAMGASCLLGDWNATTNTPILSTTQNTWSYTSPTNGSGHTEVALNSLAVGIPNPAWASAILANPGNYRISFNGGPSGVAISSVSGPASGTNIYTLTGTWPANSTGFPITLASSPLPNLGDTYRVSVAGVQSPTTPFSYVGEYSNGADYSPGQAVLFNGDYYKRVGEPNPGYPPGTSYWTSAIQDADTFAVGDYIIYTSSGWEKLHSAASAGAPASSQYATTIGNGTLTSIPVTHNLGTMDVVVSIYRLSDGKEVDCDVTKTSNNIVTLTFASAPTANSLRCVIVGNAFGSSSSSPSTGTSDVINVLDYGAVADWDSTTQTGTPNDKAFADALSAAQRKKVYIPAGNYALSNTLMVSWSGAIIEGEYGSNLVFTNTTGPCIQITGSEVTVLRVGIRCSTARSQAPFDPMNVGVLVSSTGPQSNHTRTRLEKMDVLYNPGHAFVFCAAAYHSVYERLLAQGCKGHGYVIDGGEAIGKTTTLSPGLATLRHLWAFNNGGHSLVIGNPNATTTPIRMLIDNFESAGNALDSAIRFTPDEAWVYGENCEIKRSAFGPLLPGAWVASKAWTLNQICSNGGSIFRCTVAGTSASSGTGPSGTGSITDGTVTWVPYVENRMGLRICGRGWIVSNNRFVNVARSVTFSNEVCDGNSPAGSTVENCRAFGTQAVGVVIEGTNPSNTAGKVTNARVNLPLTSNMTVAVQDYSAITTGNVITTLPAHFTPATLAATNHNYDWPLGKQTLRLTAASGGSSITGLLWPSSGRQVRLVNVGSNNLTLAHQNIESTDINRIVSPTEADYVLTTNNSAVLEYDATSQRWRIQSVGASASSSTTATETITTSGTITALSPTSARVQVIAPGTPDTHTVALPSSVGHGASWQIINNSTGVVTVTSSNGDLVASLAAYTAGEFSSRALSPTLGTHWVGSVYGYGDVLTVRADLTLEGTDGTTFTFPSTSGTVVTQGSALGTPVSGNLAGCTGYQVSNLTGVGDFSGIFSRDIDSAGFLEPLSIGESTLSRRLVAYNTLGSTNGFLRLTYFTARKTETITQIRVLTGATGAVGATSALIGVYSVNPVNGDLSLLASVSDTSLFATAQTAYTRTLSSSVSKVRGQRYAIGFLVVGTTVAPTYPGISGGLPSSEIGGQEPKLAGFVASQTELPSSLTASQVANHTQQFYAVLLPGGI
jgi:hypothetical protein